jgi:HAD superfamily hydrolase (TIGR01509 family)
MPSYQGVLLDVDGTLVDSNDAHARAWVRAFRDHGFEVAYDEIRERIGKGGDKIVRELIGLDKDDPKSKAISDDRAAIFLRDELPNVRAFPHVRDLLKRMKERGLKLVVASSAKRKELEKRLAIVGADEFLEDATSSDDAEESKPDPHIVEAALDRIGLPAERVVLLGDTPYDVESAARAGVGAIALRCGGWDDADLKGAVAVYDDPGDLLARYNASPLGGS